MKKTIFPTLIALAILFNSCESFTDLEPKGKNLLQTAENLDALLNYEYRAWADYTPAMVILTNVVLPPQHIPSLIAEPVKTNNYALLTWDESVDRVALTASDNQYEEMYKIIGTICNPIILRADNVTGDQTLAMRVKAEAYVLRAWFHYLAVNLYAKAYDPATAATDGGVAYVFETEETLAPAIKYTVQEVYDYILADLDAALELNSLPDMGMDRQRVGKAFLYAVQAKVLMSMRHYPEALTAARNSLSINDLIDNHNDMIVEMPSPYPGVVPNPLVWQRPVMESAEDLFVTITNLIYSPLSTEITSQFDPNAVILQYMPTFGVIAGYDILGIDLSDLFYGVPSLKVWGLQEETVFSGAGLTTVDMHLTEAECLMRDGQLSPAMEKLEHIRTHRIVTDLYAPLSATTRAEVFAVLKQLSRCDNFFTFKDFIDLKRWNTEEEYAETMRKVLFGVEYELAPGSDLWIFPFPQSATNYNTGLLQN